MCTDAWMRIPLSSFSLLLCAFARGAFVLSFLCGVCLRSWCLRALLPLLSPRVSSLCVCTKKKASLGALGLLIGLRWLLGRGEWMGTRCIPMDRP